MWKLVLAVIVIFIIVLIIIGASDYLPRVQIIASPPARSPFVRATDELSAIGSKLQGQIARIDRGLRSAPISYLRSAQLSAARAATSDYALRHSALIEAVRANAGGRDGQNIRAIAARIDELGADVARHDHVCYRLQP